MVTDMVVQAEEVAKTMAQGRYKDHVPQVQRQAGEIHPIEVGGHRGRRDCPQAGYWLSLPKPISPPRFPPSDELWFLVVRLRRAGTPPFYRPGILGRCGIADLCRSLFPITGDRRPSLERFTRSGPPDGPGLPQPPNGAPRSPGASQWPYHAPARLAAGRCAQAVS